MNLSERRKYLNIMRLRYHQAARQERSALLEEMQAVTPLHRKTIIRLLRTPIPSTRKARKRERGRLYGQDVRQAVARIAQALDYSSAERLQPALVSTADLLVRHGELQADEHLRVRLSTISVSTVRRILAEISPDKPRPSRHHHATNALQREVPARRIAWDIGEVVHFEVDLVHHCGASSAGE